MLRKEEHTARNKLPQYPQRWRVLAQRQGFVVPFWKRTIFQIAEDLHYHMTDQDICLILQDGTTEIQAENIMRRYRLA